MTEHTDINNSEVPSCLICSSKLIYFTEACEICGKKFNSNARCENGHFVCDECHGEKALENIVSLCLSEIGKIGGPRCCKRGAFVSIRETTAFIKENLGIDMEMPDKIICSFYKNNNECLAANCPFFPKDLKHNKPNGK